MVNVLRGVASLTTAVALTVLPIAAGADWNAIAHPPAHAESGGRAARVENEGGYRLTIFMRDASTLVGVLDLPTGLETLDAAGCPTFAVDDSAPEKLHQPTGRCESRALSARVRLAEVAEGAVDSPILLQLLNGETLTVRLRLTHAGYRETRFSLKGSKQALKSALPSGTVIVGD